MAKQLNVSLAFSADTSQAKAQIQSLQNSLNNLLKSTNVGASLGLNTEINSAITNVAKLKAQLDSATNVKTGQLDLGKFNESLKKSGTTLSQYAKSLQNLGPEGDKAFSQLAQAITTAEVPLRRTSGLLAEFGTTLKNTARWQISSSVLHGLQGAMQSAWSYAKDLNESLTDIRIVTGQSTDQMAKFAEQANKAAKTLGTTTTKYTDAALIYYQQGLSDKEVIERTNVTTKMANVTGETATDVSSYMTAVWNNFNKAGDESAEHYADIMTKLGAETAASTDEIAAGLSKFSAVADTIGLSFEMASSAVTAIIDQTRESPEVVGTALKTIFSRMEGLKQGETLEDGVDLNKYSEGLAKVGVSIMDASGQLKDMDTILYDVGTTWETLNKEQQVALAQTVAGTRQYNQFIALFDNWDKVQENLLMAGTAEGTLQEQADIYAESWEAASNRVKAAWQGIYDSLLDDDFIIDLTNGFADFLSIIERLIDSMGGFKGVMTVVGAVMMKTFSADMTRSLENMAYNIKAMSSSGHQKILDLRKDANKNLGNLYRDNEKTEIGTLKADIFENQANAQDALINKQEELLSKGKSLTEEEQKQAQIMLDIVKAKNESVLKTIQEKEELDQINQKTQTDVATWARRHSTGNQLDISGQLKEYGAITQDHAMLSGLVSSIDVISPDENLIDEKQLERIKTLMTGVKAETEDVQKVIDIFIDSINQDDIGNGIKKLKGDLAEFANQTDEKYNDIIKEATLNTAYQDGKNLDDLIKKVDEFGEGCTEAGEKTAEMRRGLLNSSDAAKEAGDNIDSFTGKVYTAADGITALASMMMNVTMAIQGIKNLGSIWENEDLSTGEKILQTMTSMSMILPALISLLDEQNYAKLAGIPIDLAKIAGYTGEKVAAKGAAVATGELTVATYSLGGAVKFLLSSFWPLLIVAGLVTAALVGLYRKTHQARKELEDQTKTLKDLKDQYTDVANSIQDVNSQLEDLESKSDTLKNLEYGTAKWREQLMEVNNSASDLIEKYGLIEGKDWFVDSSGKINIKDEAKEKIENQNIRALRAAQAAKDTQEYVVSNAEKEALIEEIQYDQSYRGFTGKERETHTGGKNRSPKVIKETSGLEESQIRDVLTILDNALDNEKTFDLSNKDNLIDLGVNEEVANIIASNEKLQGSIEKLTISTDEASSTYAQTFISDFASNQNLKDEFVKAEVDEEMYGAIYQEMAEDSSRLVEEKVNALLENTDVHDNLIKEYTDLVGIKEKDGEYYRADDTEYENAIEGGKDAVLKEAANWKAVEDAISDTTTEAKDYIKAAKSSENNWKSAEKIQKPFKTYLSLLEKEKALKKDGKKLSDEDEKAKITAIENVKTELGGLLDLNETALQNLLDPQFVEKNADLIEQAIEGDASALQELKIKAAEDIIIGLNFEEGKEEQLLNELAIIESILPDLEVGASLDESGIKQQLMNIVLACATTAEQAQEMFNMLGFPEVEFVEVGAPVGGTSRTNFYEVPDPNNPGETIRITTQDLVSFGGEKFYYPVTKNSKYTPDLSKFKLDSGSRDSGRGGGGGGGETKKTKSFNKIEDVTEADDAGERYKEINDQLSDQERLLSRLNSQDDKLFGAKKVENLKKINKELENQNKLLEDKKQEAITNAKSDKKELDTLLSGKKSKNKDYYKFAKQVSEDFHFDKKNGNIDNYNDVIKDIYQVLEDAEKDFNKKYGGKEFKEGSKKALAAEAAEQNIENIKEWIDAIENGIENYEEANEVIKDTTEEQLDNLDEILSNNFSMLSEVLDNRLMLEEMETTKIDYQMKSIENDFYKKAEYVGLQKQMGQQSEDSLNISQEHIKELERAYKKGDISQADYVAGIKEQYDQIYTDLSDIADRDQEMLEYYGDALAEANEELSKYTTQMEHLSSVLDHYKNVLSLSGQEEDYDKMGEVLDAQAQILSNNHAVAKSNYEMHKANQEQLEKDLEAIKDKNSFEYKIVQENLDAQIAATNEAHAEMMSSAESYLEALNEIWENQTKKLAKTLEKNLTNGMTFDRLLESLQNTKDIANEYLTDTNKVFETNKMLSQIQNDIDKTNNVAAKNRLNNFSKEIEALQEKDKLSNLELEIAQAKYKQLQAQIALEEAQNAKSVVRLSRDNEGNYGYVYTADQDAIGAAEEELAQAKNDLYNIQLNATNEYGEKSIQARQELYQALTEIDNTYAKDSDEWFAAREEAMQEYYDKCNVYTELYGIAQQGDSRVVEEAWVNSYAKIIDDGGKWQSAVTQYVSDVKTAYDEWKLQMDEQVKPIVGDTLTDLEGKTKAVKDESEKLRDQVVTKTIPGIDGTLDKVKAQTTEYGKWRDNVADLISNMQTLADMEAVNIKNEVVTEYKAVYTEEGKKPKEPKKESDKKKEPEQPTKEENKKPTKSRVKAAYDAINSGSWGNGASRVKNGLAAGYTSEEISLAQQLVDLVYEKSKGGKAYSFADGWKAIGFKTGGYTGEWGPEGKLAMLHEKEIVLNKEDSANILKVVELVRTMIDTNAANAGLGILHSPGINTQNQNLEQTVTITAEFPNATNHNEIEMAFNSLINRASQYANRK